MARGWLLAVLVSGVALGQERVRVAVHPIVAPGVDDAKLVVELNREVQNILADTQRVTLVSADDVERRLAEEGGRCPSHGKERTDCLERVALATRAAYVIAVVVKRLGRDYELSGSIACADRVPLKQPETLTASDNGAVKIDVALKHQLRALLIDKMHAGELPADPRTRPGSPVATVPQVVVVNNPPQVVEKQPETGTPTLRVASFVAGAVAVAGGLTALGLGLSANSDAHGLNESNGVLQDPAQLGRVNDSRNKATIAAAMGGVAAAAAVGAVVMFVFSMNEEPKAAIAPAPLGSGGGLVWSGRFP